MRVKNKTSSDLRLVLAGMITDPVVCSRVASQWKSDDGGLFSDREANLIASWCIKHLNKYGTPPNGQIQNIFDKWAEQKNVSEERALLVEKKLRYVSKEYDDAEDERADPLASDYILDRAGKYFNKVRLKRQWEEAEAEIDSGEVEGAIRRMTGLKRVEMGSGSLIRLNEDYGAWREVLDEEREEPLLYYPKDLNTFFYPMTARDNFLAFMGPDKSFKSWWIMDAGFRALKNRKRIAFFEVGDMSRDQIMKRMAARFARRPIREGSYRVPILAKSDSDGKLDIEWDSRKTMERMTPQTLFRAVKKACRNRDVFRLSCHPNDSIDVFGIESILRDWERSNWIPDVILIDYADILAPPKGVKEELSQIDTTWKALRRLSQEFHCLLITGTQSNAAAYSGKQTTLGKRHFSGRKTKMAHVTGMIGLNVTDNFREKCITGLNWIVRREGRYTERYMVKVVGCLDIANPAMKFVKNFQKNSPTTF